MRCFIIKDKTARVHFSGGMVLTISLITLGVATITSAVIGGVYSALTTFFYPSNITMHRGGQAHSITKTVEFSLDEFPAEVAKNLASADSVRRQVSI